MSFEDSFFRLWNRIDGLEIQEPVDSTYCVYALSFQKWIKDLSNIMETTTAVSVNQAKILLTDKYFDWERLVPLAHRLRLSPQGHKCIYHVFKNAYERLRIVELSLIPPPIYIPVQPLPEPKPRNIAGLFLGEGFDGGDDE